MLRPFTRYRALRNERRWVRWLEDGVLIALALGAMLAWQTRGLVAAGEPAPAFTFRDLDGRTWRLEDLRGKPVVLHLWAPWCGVCKTETSTFSRLHQSVGDRAHVVSVALSYRSESDVRRFVETHGPRYPVLLGDEAFLDDYRVEAFPTTYFLSPEGRITGSSVGVTTTLGLRYRLWRAR
jgi:peroxiredoxin